MKLKIKRMLAVYIDFFIAMTFSNILTFGNFNVDASLPAMVIAIILDVVLMYLFLTRKDLIFKNASIGKKLLGIKIVDIQNNDIDNKTIEYIVHKFKNFKVVSIEPLIVFL